jgi:hypothetical protein
MFGLLTVKTGDNKSTGEAEGIFRVANLDDSSL